MFTTELKLPFYIALKMYVVYMLPLASLHLYYLNIINNINFLNISQNVITCVPTVTLFDLTYFVPTYII